MADTNLAQMAIAGRRSQLKSMSAFLSTMVSVNELVNSAVNTIGWTDCTEGHIKHYMVSLATRLVGKSLDAFLVNDLNEAGLWIDYVEVLIN